MVLDRKVVEFLGLLGGSPQFEMDGMVILDTHHRQDFALGGIILTLSVDMTNMVFWGVFLSIFGL